MIKECLVSYEHRTHKIACLVVANPIPEGVAFFLEVVDAVGIGLAFNQPVVRVLFCHGISKESGGLDKVLLAPFLGVLFVMNLSS